MRTIIFFILLITYPMHAISGQDNFSKMSKHQIADFSENLSIKYTCDINPSMMRCIGIDPSKNRDGCISLVKSVMPECKSRLLNELPNVTTKSTFEKPYTNFFMCIAMNAATTNGKFYTDIEECLAKETPKNKSK